MDCEFCKKIWNSKEEYKNQFESTWEEDNAIVMENGKPSLYVPCDDWYYAKTVMQINYCPNCGAKLANKKVL